MLFSMYFLYLSALLLPRPILSFDFGKDKAGTNWRILNDGVMGGLSEGNFELANNSLVFSGEVSLANNGGFTSVRSPFEGMDLSNAQTVVIRWRSQGYQISLTLETSQVYYQPYFKVPLPTTEEWQELRIPLASFRAFRLGRATGATLSAREAAKVIRLGLITDEKKPGPFFCEVDYIRFE